MVERHLSASVALPVYAVSYRYDKLGRVSDKTEVVGMLTRGERYTYDQRGRLWEVYTGNEDCGAQGASCALAESFGYDPNGNRTSHTVAGQGATSPSYDAQDRLTSYGVWSYSYTPAGELTAKTNGSDTWTFVYDVLGNLRRVDKPGGDVI